MKLILILCFVHLCVPEDTEQYVRLSSELELIDWDLQDECTDISTSIKNFWLGGPNGLSDKINIELSHYNYLKTQSNNLLKYSEDLPYELTRNWTFFTKPGDALLEGGDIKSLVTFANKNLDATRTTKISCENEAENKDCKLKKQDVLHELATTRNVTSLENVWTNWQTVIETTDGKDYANILNLVTKAAISNDKYDAKTYWEFLSEYEEGFAKAEGLWEEIQPLYQKLYNFVKVRLNNYYNTTYENIPVYLLGSNFGEDWSNIADIVLPHPQIYHDIKVELQSKGTKKLYKYAETFTKSMGLGILGKHFWKNSNFNFERCGPEVLNFCAEKFTEILTCDESTIENYLKSHEAAVEILLNRDDFTSLPRQNLRYSAVTEAVSNLGSTFALNNLPMYELLPADVFTNDVTGSDNKMMFLLMTALRIFPKLSYYMAADRWRLEELETPSENLKESWWNYRNKFQEVQISPNKESDFVEDPMIIHNKPYLSKFLGTILQFQILNYYQMNLFQDNSNMVKNFKADSTLSGMIKDRANRGIIDLIGYYYGFDEVSAYPLMEFFAPLQDYMDTAPLEQSKFEIKTPKPEIIVPTTTKPTKPQRKNVKTIVVEPKPVAIQNDQVTNTSTKVVKLEKYIVDVPKSGNKKKDETTQNAGVYVGAGIVILTLCGIIAVIVIKYAKKKPKTNNRRHDP